MSDTRFIFATALLSSVCFSAQALALTMSDVAASNLIHTDTYTSTPSAEPAASFAQLDKTYKLAGVCFLGHGDCGGAGGGEYDSFGEGLDVPGSYLCQNAGYKTCSAGQIGNPATVCPDDENYFKECKCNYAEMTPGTYNNNCGPLATVSDSMTKCNQSNELLLDKSQYCQNPKEGTRWYGKGACLVCTAPKVPNSSTKTCSCPTNYKVCTSPSVGVGAGCEDNGVMKYTSCECPADYVTCTWGPAPGSASCNTGSGMRYKSCKPDPKTCDEWIQYKYGTPRDVDASSSSGKVIVFKDTNLSDFAITSTKEIEFVNYDYAPEGLCTGRTNPVLSVDTLTRLNVNYCSGEGKINVKQASLPYGATFDGKYGGFSFSCHLIVDNVYAGGSMRMDSYGDMVVNDTMVLKDGGKIYMDTNIKNLVVENGNLTFGGYTGGGNIKIDNISYNTSGEISLDRVRYPLSIGSLNVNVPSGEFMLDIDFTSINITKGIFINSSGNGTAKIIMFQTNDEFVEMNNTPLEMNVPGSITIDSQLKHPSKIVMTKGDLVVDGGACITMDGHICCAKMFSSGGSSTTVGKKTFSTRTEITSASQLSDFLTCIPE